MTSLSLRRLTLIAAAVVVFASACQTAEPTVSEPPATTAIVTSSSLSTSVSTTTEIAAPDRYVLPNGFDLQGHRGARGLKPENTLPAFETALDLMVTTLEFDLHLTADGDIVVWHDPFVDASKCGLRSNAPAEVPDPDDDGVSNDALAVSALTAEQLSWYQCDRNPDPGRFPIQDASSTPVAGSLYSIVTLDSLIDFVERYAADGSKSDDQRRAANGVRFNMETKRKNAEPETIGDTFDGETPGLFESRVLEIIEDHNIADRTTIQSFDIDSLRAIRSVDPKIPLAFLESRPTFDFEELASWNINEWSPNLELATEQRVSEAHRAGLGVKPWTIVSVDEARGLIEAGVDGLITDRPDLFSVGR
jgi:glycerophosphoryl diester phosphodiesterase